jgi:hypothetical protein
MNLVFLLRAAGAGLIVLSLFHAVLWRTLSWGREIERLSPLNARVFAVHTFFIAFVLGALGLLSLLGPELLLLRSDLARLLLTGIVAFWVARLTIQPLVFDPVMRAGFMSSRWMRASVSLVWLGYVAVYGAALFVQLREGPR